MPPLLVHHRLACIWLAPSPPSPHVRRAALLTVSASSAPAPPSQPTPAAADAWAALATFTAADAAGAGAALVATQPQRAALRAALLAAASHPNPAAGWEPPGPPSTSTTPPRLLLGVLASSLPLAARALRDYCGALGVPYVPPPSAAALPPASGVFLKWRPGPPAEGEGQQQQQAGRAAAAAPPAALVTASPYAGPDRGVLVTLGSHQFGHLPLGLIDEDRTAAPPALG